MFRLFIISFFLLSWLNVDAQNQYAFRVTFNNKKETSFDITKPSDFLSSRSIDRRISQSIGIDSSDLPVVQKYIDSVLFLSNGQLHSRSKWLNNCVLLVNDSSTIHLIRGIDFVQQVRFVAFFTSPLHLAAKSNSEIPVKKNESAFSFLKTTGGVGYYGDAYDQIKLANGDYLHDKGYRGKGKLIAVLDEGFNYTNTLLGFDSLRKTNRILDTYNFNLDTNHVFDFSSHGTQVLSTMAGIINGSYVGTAPDADYALYVTENGSSEQPFEMDNLVAAMERSDSIGADIISISLGYNTFNIGSTDASLRYSELDGKSTIAAMGANFAGKKGILVVSSAGNEGGGSWGKILTPGDADSVLTCGSVDINKLLASTSGRGPNAAGKLKPNVCMLGAPGIVFNNSGTTSTVGGTSIATPQLAGLAACLWQSRPFATPFQLRKAIQESAHIASSPNNEMGYGVPDFGKAFNSFLSIPPCVCSENNIYVFPNPFVEKITIQIIGNQKQNVIQWYLSDMQGKSIISGQRTENTTVLAFEITTPSNLATGNYLFHIQSSEFEKVFKIEKR